MCGGDCGVDRHYDCLFPLFCGCNCGVDTPSAHLCFELWVDGRRDLPRTRPITPLPCLAFKRRSTSPPHPYGRCHSSSWVTFFESFYLGMHWSDSNDHKQSAMVLQTNPRHDHDIIPSCPTHAVDKRMHVFETSLKNHRYSWAESFYDAPLEMLYPVLFWVTFSNPSYLLIQLSDCNGSKRTSDTPNHPRHASVLIPRVPQALG